MAIKTYGGFYATNADGSLRLYSDNPDLPYFDPGCFSCDGEMLGPFPPHTPTNKMWTYLEVKWDDELFCIVEDSP